jgi:hypothetical protein
MSQGMRKSEAPLRRFVAIFIRSNGGASCGFPGYGLSYPNQGVNGSWNRCRQDTFRPQIGQMAQCRLLNYEEIRLGMAGAEQRPA